MKTKMPANKGTWPCFDDDEIAAVTEVLSSGKVNYWTGDTCQRFENEFAAYCDSDYAIAVANGTLALELALRAIGLTQGDEVIVTPRTFIASASAIVMCGAKPVFADVDRDSQNISADTIAPVITDKTKAIITVHFTGLPCDMDPILELAEKYQLKVIEDCAQAHGARYKGKPVGSLGHIAAFSFCQDKIMTTGGEGGMVVTSDPQLWKSIWSFKDHGKDYDEVFNKQHPQGFRWLHTSFGSNYRMTAMQAAIGSVQLRKLPHWLKQRRDNAAYLLNRLSAVQSLRVPYADDNLQHSHYKFYVFIRPECLSEGWSRDRILAEITARGISCFTGSCPEIYLEQAFEADGLRPACNLPIAHELGETSLLFLVHPTLNLADMESVCNVVEEVMVMATNNAVNHSNIIDQHADSSEEQSLVKQGSTDLLIENSAQANG